MPKNEKNVKSKKNKVVKHKAIPMSPLLVLFMWGLKHIILECMYRRQAEKKEKIPSSQHMESSRGGREDVLVKVVVSE